MIYHFKSQKKLLFFILLITSVLYSCTTIPTEKFVTYKEAFNNARVAGEEVLLDYAANLKEYNKLSEEIKKAEESQPEKEFPGAIDRPEVFDPVKEADNKVEADDIEVRLRAWDVAARFNDLLTGLAEGKSVNELTAAVDGLATSLSNFPLEEIAGATAAFMPYIGLLKTIIATAEQERTRQLFVKAVKQGGPLIEKKFMNLLREDTKKFYNIEWGLNDFAYQSIRDEVRKLRKQYIFLASKYKSDDKLKELTDEVDKLCNQLKFKEIKLKNKDANKEIEKDPTGYSQLVQIKEQIRGKVAEARKKTNELYAYQDMMLAYVKLLNQVSASLESLRLAIEKNQPAIPSTKELVPIFIELKKAIYIYKDKRRG